MDWMIAVIIVMSICYSVMIITQLVFRRNRKIAKKKIILEWADFFGCRKI